MRVDLYTFIHKAQRKYLFDLSVKIGRSDFRDASQVSLLKKELKVMIARLKEHASNEETFIHPFFHKIGQQGNSIEREHHDLEILLEDFEKNIDTLDQSKLYTQFNRFLAVYLTHIDDEEKAQEDILWKHFDDEALLDVMKQFRARQTPTQAMEDLEFIFPGLNAEEIERILSGMKGVVPDATYQAISLMAKKAQEEK